MREALPEPGDVIAGKYEVTAVLGQGGMGCVYAVLHRLTGHRLAIKCLLPHFAQQPTLVERFLREARAAGRIHHRNVIDVLDVGCDDGLMFIVLPLLTGKLLSALFLERALAPDQLMVIMLRTMRGVAAAHAAGIVHRDLKPENVFVCEGLSGALDEPRVLDFGISKLSGEGEANLTMTGVTVGTPLYMPLEQLTGRRDIDVRADVYAIGVMLYEGLTGTVPHDAENMVALALSVLHSKPQAVHVLRPSIQRGLSDVVMRALARDREDRYPSVREFLDALLPYVSLAGHSDARVLPPPVPLLATDSAHNAAEHELRSAPTALSGPTPAPAATLSLAQPASVTRADFSAAASIGPTPRVERRSDTRAARSAKRGRSAGVWSLALVAVLLGLGLAAIQRIVSEKSPNLARENPAEGALIPTPIRPPPSPSRVLSSASSAEAGTREFVAPSARDSAENVRPIAAANGAPAAANGSTASANGAPASANGAPASANGAPASANGAPAAVSGAPASAAASGAPASADAASVMNALAEQPRDGRSPEKSAAGSAARAVMAHPAHAPNGTTPAKAAAVGRVGQSAVSGRASQAEADDMLAGPKGRKQQEPRGAPLNRDEF